MNIFVANLNYKVNDDALEELFTNYGTVDSARIIRDRFTQESKGFGFVEMPEDAEALKAIEELHDSDFNGRNLVVKKARPRDE